MPNSKVLSPDGTYYGTDFWFCSFDCFQNAAKDFMPRRYQCERAEDDPETKRFIAAMDARYPHLYQKPERDEKVNAYVDEWSTNQEFAFNAAITDLRIRLFAEQDQLELKKRKAAQEDAAKLKALEDKARERQRIIDEKRAEERAAHEAEEERWRPRPFNI